MDPDSEYQILPRPRGLTYWLRWLVRAVVFLFILLLVLIFLGYAYEDISGWMAWSKAKRQLEADGFSLDPQVYLSAPVPDAKNFGALPVFQLQPAPDRPDIRVPLVWNSTIRPVANRISYSRDDTTTLNPFPYLGRWDRNEKPDMVAVRERFAELCRKASPPITVPPDASATGLFALLSPVLVELRQENTTRPQCRFNRDADPGSMDHSEVLVNLIGLAKLLAYEESLAIHDSQPQRALDDLKIGWKVESGLAKDPLLVSGLVGMGVTAIQIGAIQEGLYDHAWNDAQLAELDADLGKIDFLSNCRHVLPGDFVAYSAPLMLRYVADRSQMTADIRRNILQMKEIDRISLSALKEAAAKQADSRQAKVEVDDSFTRAAELTLWAAYWWPPNGTLYRYMADYARVVLPSANEAIDPAAHRIYPEKIRSAPDDMSTLSTVLHAISNFASMQARLDEARIACRLERYHLAHLAYPASLDELAPAYGNDLPRDVMTGKPYRYKRQGDTYLLYSVGWNQKDDGGNGEYFTQDSPDWVWPNQPKAK
jgi:hypothetical protein